MYTTAELFTMATDPEASRATFLNNVTLSIPDDADGCVDLDSEKAKLSIIWDLAHLPMRELVARTGLSQTAFAKQAGVPRRTVQDWCGEKRACPSYVRFLLAEHYNLL
nr:MAG TPA: Regulatory protein-modification, helix-turn-helix, transcriptional regulato, DNA [Caudoviricetes sp.]